MIKEEVIEKFEKYTGRKETSLSVAPLSGQIVREEKNQLYQIEFSYTNGHDIMGFDSSGETKVWDIYCRPSQAFCNDDSVLKNLTYLVESSGC